MTPSTDDDVMSNDEEEDDITEDKGFFPYFFTRSSFY